MILTLPRTTTAASAAAPCCIFLYPFSVLRAGDAGGFSTDAEAGVSQLAYGAVQSLSRRDGVQGPRGWRLRVWQCHRARNERSVWSVGPGGGLVREGWWALAVQGLGDLRLPDPDKDRRRGKGDGLRGLGRDGPPCERGTDVDAGYQGEREQAQAFEYWYLATTLMRAYRAVCGGLVPTLSAPTAGTAVSWAPGRLFRPGTSTDRSIAVASADANARTARKWSGGKASRNSEQVELYLGGTGTKVVWRTRSDTRPLAPGRPRAKRLRRRTPRTALRFPARDGPSHLDVGATVLHFAPTNTSYPLIRASKRKSQAAVPTAGVALPES